MGAASPVLWLAATMASTTTFGYYAALNLVFDATPEDLKKAFRKLSLKYHPDRCSDEAAKDIFQNVNTSHACLSDAAKRAEYDALFRMRCVLEQGRLTPDDLRGQKPLDSLYMFSVSRTVALGMKEDSVLMVNLIGPELAKGSVERWRHGECMDARPLTALRAVDAEPSAAGPRTTLKLTFQEEKAKNVSTQQLMTRSTGDCATLVALLRALIAHVQRPPEGATPLLLAKRIDDSQMPPAAKLTAFLTLKPNSKSGLSGVFAREHEVFAMLGRSKLLLFADALCTNLRSLITLEASIVSLTHEDGTKDFELSLPPSSGGKGEKGRFKLALAADTPFVASQWVGAINECLLLKGIEEIDAAYAADEVLSSPAVDPGSAAPSPGGRPRGQSEGGGPDAPMAPPPSEQVDVAVGDLLGDLSSPRSSFNSSTRTTAAPAVASAIIAAEIDAAHGQPFHELVPPTPAEGRQISDPMIDLLTPSPPRGAQQAVSSMPRAPSADPFESLFGDPNLFGAAPAAPAVGATRDVILYKPAVGSRMGLDIDEIEPGVVAVCEVAPGSLAAQAGLCVGDTLLMVSGQPVHTTDAAADLLSAAVGSIRMQVRSAAAPAAAPAPLLPPPSPPSPPPPPPPAAPTSEACAPSVPYVETDGRSGSVVAEWQMPAWASVASPLGETRIFEVHWRRNGTDTWLASEASQSVGPCRVRLHGLAPGSEYWVRVRSLGLGVLEAPSKWSTCLVPARVGASPPFDVGDGRAPGHIRAPSDGGVAAATSSMVRELQGMGLGEEDAVGALRATGMQGVAAAVEWHFTNSAAAGGQPRPPTGGAAPLIPNLLD